jgi:hypothetical protein
MPNTTAAPPPVTWEFVIDLLDGLERHGYRKSPSGRDVDMVTPLVPACTGIGDDG